MASLRIRLATGARWTVSIRVVERVIGFVSTLILARLLAPQDFGVVAMGTAIQEILAAVTSFGFTQALIRMRGRSHAAYSTAFTLHVITGAVIALLLVAAIPLSVRWYDDARVSHVLLVLAASSFITGFRNPGLVRYERALRFRPFFAIALARKLASFGTGAVVALLVGDYRALLAGMLVGAIVETAITYRLTRFRPRFTLARSRELLGFSIWWLGSQASMMLGRRGQDVLVGQRLGAEALGQYGVALDLATMPSTEIVAPLMRAVYPGYMQMQDDPGRLGSAFVRVWGIIALLTIPSATGIACLSGMVTDVVLGPKWQAAATLMAWLAPIGTLQAMVSCFWPILLTRRGPRANFRLAALGMLLSIPAFAIALWQLDLIAAIAAWICALIVVVCTGAHMLSRDLQVSGLRLFGALVRPLVGSGAMALSLLAVLQVALAPSPWFLRAGVLVLLVAFGALVYAATVAALWTLAGRPKSAEAEFLFAVAARLRPD